MSEINLPEPYGWLHDANGNDPLTFAREMKPMTALLCSTLGVYTAEQVRAAILAERERCAALCDILAHEDTTCQGDMTDLYKFGEAIRRG